VTAPSRPGFSRRALFGLGGGTLLLAGAAAWRRRPSRAEAAAVRADAPIPYADHEGWMVSLAEKRALQAQQTPGGGR
jgi:hypothetical protein